MRAWRIGVFGLFAGVVLGAHANADRLVRIEEYNGAPMQFKTGTPALVTLTYADALDPERVALQIDGRDYSQLLDPEPGTSEQLRLPLKPGRTRVVISASGVAHASSRIPEQVDRYEFIRTLDVRPRVEARDSGGGERLIPLE